MQELRSLEEVGEVKGHTLYRKNFTVANKRGFSLLEVLVAISILSVGILATASMQGAATRSNVIADTRTRATTLAADRIEKLVSTPITDWSNPPPTLTDADNDGQSGLDDTGFDNDPTTQGDADNRVVDGQYTIYWNVADDFPIANTKTVKVIVTWQFQGVTGKVSMERVIPRII